MRNKAPTFRQALAEPGRAHRFFGFHAGRNRMSGSLERIFQEKWIRILS
jgi:hypothetical protein